MYRNVLLSGAGYRIVGNLMLRISEHHRNVDFLTWQLLTVSSKFPPKFNQNRENEDKKLEPKEEAFSLFHGTGLRERRRHAAALLPFETIGHSWSREREEGTEGQEGLEQVVTSCAR